MNILPTRKNTAAVPNAAETRSPEPQPRFVPSPSGQTRPILYPDIRYDIHAMPNLLASLSVAATVQSGKPLKPKLSPKPFVDFVLGGTVAVSARAPLDPRNIGNRIFPISSYHGNIGNLNFHISS